MIRVEIRQASKAVYRVRPVAGPPDAALVRAGFTGAAGQTCQIGPVLTVALHGDAEAAGALAASRLLPKRRVAAELAGVPVDQAVAFAAGLIQRSWRMTRLRTRDVEPGLERLDLVRGWSGWT